MVEVGLFCLFMRTVVRNMYLRKQLVKTLFLKSCSYIFIAKDIGFGVYLSSELSSFGPIAKSAASRLNRMF